MNKNSRREAQKKAKNLKNTPQKFFYFWISAFSGNFVFLEGIFSTRFLPSIKEDKPATFLI